MLFNAGVSHRKIRLPLGLILYNMTKEDCGMSLHPNMEVYVPQFLLLEIEEDNEYDFWSNNEDEQLINWMHIYEEVKSK
eukprot:4182093-Ditylum_brightwellii.AAC.1